MSTPKFTLWKGEIFQKSKKLSDMETKANHPMHIRVLFPQSSPPMVKGRGGREVREREKE